MYIFVLDDVRDNLAIFKEQSQPLTEIENGGGRYIEKHSTG